MSKKILNVATFGLAGALMNRKKSKSAPDAAAPAGPTIMPLPDDERILQARKRGIIKQRARQGRDSTILTGDRLGG